MKQQVSLKNYQRCTKKVRSAMVEDLWIRGDAKSDVKSNFYTVGLSFYLNSKQ